MHSNIWGSLFAILGWRCQQQCGWAHESPQIIKICKLWPSSHTANPARIIPDSDISSLSYQECVCITVQALRGSSNHPVMWIFFHCAFTRAEKLQLLNHRPVTAVEIQLVSNKAWACSKLNWEQLFNLGDQLNNCFLMGQWLNVSLHAHFASTQVQIHSASCQSSPQSPLRQIPHLCLL